MPVQRISRATQQISNEISQTRRLCSKSSQTRRLCSGFRANLANTTPVQRILMLLHQISNKSSQTRRLCSGFRAKARKHDACTADFNACASDFEQELANTTPVQRISSQLGFASFSNRFRTKARKYDACAADFERLRNGFCSKNSQTRRLCSG